MKKLVLLLLLLVPVHAATLQRGDFVNGDIVPSEYELVMCEREKRHGAVSIYDDRMCCLNRNQDGYCDNDEPVLGTCYAELCMWPTETFKIWYSWRYRPAPCGADEWGFLAGKEYNQVMKGAGCYRENSYWCCSDEVFPQEVPKQGEVVAEREYESTASPPTGALMVLTGAKWKALQRGMVGHPPEMRALDFERERCRKGGEDVRIIDPAYGSFFLDKTNVREGMRVFYLTKEFVIPLVSSCDA